MDNTAMFDVNDIKSANIKKTLNEVTHALETNGYNATNQLVGYLISGDPGYITSKMNAREKLLSIDRTDIVEEILKGYLSE